MNFISFLQAIGIYMSICFLFSIAALIETILVIYIDKLRKSIQDNIDENNELDTDIERQMGIATSDDSLRHNPLFHLFKFTKRMTTRMENERKRSKIDRAVTDPRMLRLLTNGLRPSKVDFYARLIFPIAFYAFNIVYWSYFLTQPQ